MGFRSRRVPSKHDFLLEVKEIDVGVVTLATLENTSRGKTCCQPELRCRDVLLAMDEGIDKTGELLFHHKLDQSGVIRNAEPIVYGVRL